MFKNDHSAVLGFIIGVLSVPLMMGVLSIFIKDDKINEIEYKFQDTLEFIDKDTEETIERFDNVEFRVLGPEGYMYMVKMTTGPSPEVLVMNQFPPNTYLRFYQTPEKVK
jgi:hypothetical protein